LTNGALTRNFFRHWDANNHWAWQGFIARGDRPFVDFWYPYAGLWVLNLPLPVGAIAEFLHYVMVYAALGGAIWRIGGRRVVLPLLACLVILFLSTAAIVESPERYLLSVAVALLVALFALRGELAGVIETNLELAAGSIYGVIPTDIAAVLRSFPDMAALDILVPLFLLFAGAHFFLQRQNETERRLALAIV